MPHPSAKTARARPKFARMANKQMDIDGQVKSELTTLGLWPLPNQVTAKLVEQVQDGLAERVTKIVKQVVTPKNVAALIRDATEEKP